MTALYDLLPRIRSHANWRRGVRSTLLALSAAAMASASSSLVASRAINTMPVANSEAVNAINRKTQPATFRPKIVPHKAVPSPVIVRDRAKAIMFRNHLRSVRRWWIRPLSSPTTSKRTARICATTPAASLPISEPYSGPQT